MGGARREVCNSNSAALLIAEVGKGEASELLLTKLSDGFVSPLVPPSANTGGTKDVVRTCGGSQSIEDSVESSILTTSIAPSKSCSCRAVELRCR